MHSTIGMDGRLKSRSHSWMGKLIHISPLGPHNKSQEKKGVFLYGLGYWKYLNIFITLWITKMEDDHKHVLRKIRGKWSLDTYLEAQSPSCLEPSCCVEQPVSFIYCSAQGRMRIVLTFGFFTISLASFLLATLVAPHLTPVSKSVGGS